MKGESKMNTICHIPSPVGLLTVAGEEQAITGLWLEEQKYFAMTLDPQATEGNLPVFDQLREWLEIYFRGEQPNFSIPLAPKGTQFRQSVWEVLKKIPYGTLVTYGDIARQLNEAGAKTSPRAVGGAVGHNPISILIPCHRVVGSNSSLTGYAGGLDNKIKLLQLEKIDLKKS